jgi:hypothetical protein
VSGSGWVEHDERLPSRVPTWTGGAFRDELRAWVEDQVGKTTSLQPTKQRVWATVWCAETKSGRFYAKQNCARQSFEAALVATLARLDPHRVVPVEATDVERGLLLTPDQGAVVGEGATADDLGLWARVVLAGALLQRELAGSADELVASGLTTIRPDQAPAYVERRVDELAGRPAGDPLAVPPEQAAALRDHLPVIRGWADRVAALGLPLTLNHNDLHERNVFDRAGELRFFDFADSLLAEPLAALLIPLNILSHRLEAGPDDPRLWRVVEPALEVWSDLAPAADLRDALPAALQLARLGRVESWLRCTVSMSDAERTEWGDSAPAWLATLLEDPPLGRARG